MERELLMGLDKYSNKQKRFHKRAGEILVHPKTQKIPAQQSQRSDAHSRAKEKTFHSKRIKVGTWVTHWLRLPLAQVMILESWDGVLNLVTCGESASPSAYISASLCVS